VRWRYIWDIYLRCHADENCYTAGANTDWFKNRKDDRKRRPEKAIRGF
jgi:hypothetical protein